VVFQDPFYTKYGLPPFDAPAQIGRRQVQPCNRKVQVARAAPSPASFETARRRREPSGWAGNEIVPNRGAGAWIDESQPAAAKCHHGQIVANIDIDVGIVTQ
jgi:hypothetical protein